MSNLKRLFCKAALVTTIIGTAVTDGVLWHKGHQETNLHQEGMYALGFYSSLALQIGAALALGEVSARPCKQEAPKA
jgi:hypothetical protein